jgi:hypothetical protein
MHISKKITSLLEPLDIDLQLMASELDTSVIDMKYISKSIMNDALTVEAFEKLCEDIEKIEGNEITAFDDNTILYEYMDEAIVLHSISENKYIIFDSLVSNKIENKMNSYI